MNEAVKLLYRLFLGTHPLIVKSCTRYEYTVEIKVILWKGARPYTITLLPRHYDE